MVPLGVALGLALVACSAPSERAITIEPPVQTVWFVGVDVSRSVPAGEFSSYGTLLRSSCLVLLRPGDRVVTLRLGDAELSPETLILGTRTHSFTAEVGDLARRLQLAQVKSKAYGTDLGDVFHFVRTQIEQEATARPSIRRRYLVVVSSDGRPDGPQRRPDSKGAVGADYRLLFTGVHAEYVETLKKLARDAGFDKEGATLVVEHRHWAALAQAGTLQAFLGRSVNGALVSMLQGR